MTGAAEGASPATRWRGTLVGAGLIAGGIAIAFAVHSPYMAYSLYALALLLVLARVSSLLWLAGLEADRSVSADTIQQGDGIEVALTVKNRRGWPIPWLFIEDLYPAFCHRTGDHTRLAVLMPGRSVTIRYRLTVPKRGYHRIGPAVMESGDLFGLQRRFRTGTRQDYVSVMPTIAYIDTFNFSSRRPQGPVRVSHRIYEDPSRLAGLREYQRGDPLNRIHWKTTARTGELWTKTYEPSAVTGGTLILDMHEENYPPQDRESRMELAITTTASIAYLLQSSGEQVGMITNARDAAEVARYAVESRQTISRDELAGAVVGEAESVRISPLRVPTMRSTLQARAIAENLARVLPGHGLDCTQLLMEEFRGLPRDAALLPVVAQVTQHFALALAEMKLSGFAVSVFFVGGAPAFEEAAALLAPYRIHVFHIREESDLHELAPQKIGH
jgi:uncharacterized protein (DUF58 family)